MTALLTIFRWLGLLPRIDLSALWREMATHRIQKGRYPITERTCA